MIFDLHNPTDVQSLAAAFDGKAVGLTSGCYDLLHYLHLTYFQRCRRKCEVLIVGVDSDDLVRQTKGDGRPVIPEFQRVAMVASLDLVQATFVMDNLDDFVKVAKQLRVGKIFRNDDFKGRENEVVGASGECEVVIIPDVHMADSTSGIIKRVIQQQGQGNV
jgi:D-beta-D-heptose 7-phosphate kinase / D-beta-D-heptose 1-phosphate adenosyltransferase